MTTEFFIILFFILIGLCLKRVKAFPSNTSQILNMLIIWVSLPAVIFLQIPKIRYSEEVFIPALTPWFIIIIFMFITLGFGKLVKCDRKTLGALLLLVPLGNTSFLGIPMVKSFFGENSIPFAILYDQLGSFLALATYGVIIVSIFASGKSFNLREVLKKILIFPPFISLILAFSLKLLPSSMDLTFPPFLNNFLLSAAQTLIPLAMIAVGFQFKLKLSKKGYLALGYGLTCKLILAPLLLLFVFRVLDMNHQAVQISIFESAMPPMITAGAVSISAGLDEDLSASLVGVGLVASFITLPLIHYLILLL